tara:strand:+ start:67563 stop:67940 length:378 start_codon:yes stop_codon:yes gene_type:complete
MSCKASSEEIKFLTDERFNYSRLETKDVIKKLKENNFADAKLLDQIDKEDLLLKVKLRSYGRCEIQFLFALLIIVLSLFLKNLSSIFYIVLAIAVYFFISSFFGLLSNKVSKLEKQYSTNKAQNF